MKIINLLEILDNIIIDRDLCFTSRYWEFVSSGYNVFECNLSHLKQMESQRGQSRFWKTCLEFVRWILRETWIEIAYNSSHQSSIQMTPFEALLGRKFQSPLCCNEKGEANYWTWFDARKYRQDKAYSWMASNCQKQSEKLCSQGMKRFIISSRWLRTPESYFFQGHYKIWEKGKLCARYIRKFEF